VVLYAPREDLLQQLARPGLVAIAGGIAAAIARTLRAYVHRVQSITTTFGQYVSPAVAQKLLEQRGELPSELRHVCVMFLDIRNFTTYAEHRGPDEVVRFLNEVFAFMIDVVNAHHGVINKFLGDGFMAVFGAPHSEGSDCENAIAASRALITELEKRVADGRLAATRIGIGLHAGPAVTGNVGSLTRREYTVIGDVVNLASRVESLNKEMGSMLLVTGEVVAALKTPPSPMTAKGAVKVKGREAPVEVFQLA
jgi:adenylate cyclase